MIIDSINALTKKLTGQDGTGSDITESINDLTKKWTGSNDRGETIAEALDVLAQHAEGGGGGGGDYPTFTLTRSDGSPTVTCDKTYAECTDLCKDDTRYTYPCYAVFPSQDGEGVLTYFRTMEYSLLESVIEISLDEAYILYEADGTLTYKIYELGPVA